MYLVTLLLSGSIMVYLSINNISNIKELTEKRVLEEEQDIHEMYTQQIDDELAHLTKLLDDFISQYYETNSEIPDELRENYMIDYLIMNKNEALIRPHFSHSNYTPQSGNKSIEFLEYYSKAEQSEFQQNNYQRAQKYYIKAISEAGNANDSARVLNALSRLQIKMKNYDDALNNYEIIISKYGGCKNNFGVPYANFAIAQLLKLEELKFQDRKYQLIQMFVQKMTAGAIPFTSFSKSLLEDMEYVISDNQMVFGLESFQSEFSNIRKKIELIDTYRPLLINVLNGIDSERLKDLNGYKAIISSEEDEELLLSKFHRDQLFGFVVSLGKLNEEIIQARPIGGYQFAYELNLVHGEFKSYELEAMNYEKEFSAYFPNHQLKINLKNENAVSEFVFKRRLITSIGVFLLLVAMLIGFVVLVRDVNRKRQIELLRSDFVANVTHELKTPLTSINMFAETIQLNRLKDADGYQRYAKIIVKESERLKRMINNILEFSKSENEPLKYNLKPTNIFQVIDEVMEEMNYWLELNGFRIDLSIDDHLIAQIDEEGLKQVLSNLITNAIKYSHETKEIRIQTRYDTEKIYIDVMDQGIGIASNEQDSIFDKFYRVKTDITNAVSGTGLGLTVSRDIMKGMQGDIAVESELNKGSVFTIILNRVANEKL